MNFKSELETFAQQMSKNAPQEVLEVIGTEIPKLAESGIMESALKVGDTATDFELQNFEGETVSLSSLVKHGNTVVSFFRGNWCPFCNI